MSVDGTGRDDDTSGAPRIDFTVEPVEPAGETGATQSGADPATRAGDPPDAGPPPGRPPAGHSRRRRRLLIATVLVLVGAATAGGAYFVDSVHPGEMLSMPATTKLYYADGTELASLGTVQRTPVPLVGLLPSVAQVAVAAEDPDFWNNSTGAITRSVGRLYFGMSSDTTVQKARLAVAAWKLSDRYSKEEILEWYLNGMPFGRNAFGIEAAAAAYFHKTARRAAPPEQQLTMAETMLLLALVDQPEPSPDDPDGKPGYDPGRGPAAQENSVRRWGEIRDAMVSAGYLTPAAARDLSYPGTEVAPAVVTGGGTDRPAGLVINHVLDELTHTPESPFFGQTWQSIEDGGYTIYTTLNKVAQASVESAADETVAGSVMQGQPPNLQAAAVVVEPGTGRILAYYGGHDGKGNDYAGFYYDEKNEATGVGRNPPGSSFMVYTLAAALKAGISLKSMWQWTPHDQAGRPAANPIRNTSECTSDRVGRAGACSLLESTTQSLNVPFYDVTLSVTPAKVLEMARDAGIDYMWTDSRERQDLRTVTDMGKLIPYEFDAILGLGQYPVTVLDQANAMATFGAGGLRAKAHFVTKVMKGEQTVYGEELPNPNQPRIFSNGQSTDLNYALSQGSGVPDVASKTGTWEYNNRSDQNAHAWSIGYSKSLAMAVWVGNRADERPLIDKSGSTIWGSGLPRAIFTRTMTEAQAGMGLPAKSPFAPPVFGGRVDPPLSVAG